MKPNSKSSLDGAKKRSAASFTQLLRRISPANRKVGEGKSPYLSFSLTNPKVESKWRQCKEKMEGKEEDKGKGLRMQRKASCTDIYTEISQRSASPKSSSNSTEHPAFSLNQALTSRLRSLGPHYNTQDRFLIFQDIFSTVISLDTLWALLLRRIKNGYEEVVSQCLKCDYEHEVEKLSKQVTEVNDYLESLIKGKEELSQQLEALREENGELRTTVDWQRETLSDLQKQVETMREQGVVELREVVAGLRSREQAFISALKSAKQQNYSIDDLLRTLSRHRKTKSSEGSFVRPVCVPRLVLPDQETAKTAVTDCEKSAKLDL